MVDSDTSLNRGESGVNLNRLELQNMTVGMELCAIDTCLREGIEIDVDICGAYQEVLGGVEGDVQELNMTVGMELCAIDTCLREGIEIDVDICGAYEEVLGGVEGDVQELLDDAVRGILKLKDGNRRMRCARSLAEDLAHVKQAISAGARVSDEIMIFGVMRNDVEMVKELLVGGGNANAVTSWAAPGLGTCTILGYAVKYCDVCIVSALLEADATVDSRERMRMTPLMWASHDNRTSCVETLLKAGANVNAVDVEGRSALLFGAANGCSTMIKVLLDAGAKVNLQDAKCRTPLLIASSCGVRCWVRREPRWKVAALLLEAGADVNVVDCVGDSALLIATQYDVDKVGESAKVEEIVSYIEILIKGGVDVNAVGSGGETALLNACVSDFGQGEAIIRMLLDAGADIHARNNFGYTSLMKAVLHSHPSITCVLLERGAGVNDRCWHGGSALSMAAGRHHMELIAVLLDAGAHTDIQDRTGNTALMATFHCAGSESGEICSSWDVGRQLIDSGADVNLVDCEGRTAMLVMSQYSLVHVRSDKDLKQVKLCLMAMISSGATVDAVDGHGRSTLMLVCINQRYCAEQIVTMLLDCGANVNAGDKRGNTALMYAAKYNTECVMGVLLSRGADVNMANNDGNVVSQCNRVQHCVNRAIMLMRAGGDVGDIDVRCNDKLRAAKVTWRMQYLWLQHLAREKIRSCVMRREPGKWIAELVRKTGLPEPLVEYVADVDRFMLGSDK